MTWDDLVCVQYIITATQNQEIGLLKFNNFDNAIYVFIIY